MDLKSLTPLFDNVLIKQTGLVGVNAASNLIIENESFEIVGYVVATGAGLPNGGRIVPVQVQPGQQVLVPPRSGLKIMVDGIEHILIKEIYLLGGCVAVQSQEERIAEDLLSEDTVFDDEEREALEGEAIADAEPTTAPEVADETVVKEQPVKNLAKGENKPLENTAGRNANINLEKKDNAKIAIKKIERKAGVAAQKDTVKKK